MLSAAALRRKGDSMVRQGALAVPAMSAYDPPASDEGRLDPLGMATFADRIADTYAAPLRARMRRVRFASAMCIGALITPELEGVDPGVRGDSGDLAFERVTVEALARDAEARQEVGIPGISKAHTAIVAGQRLGASGYLKSPRVFGFHGVYRPFAISVGLVDRDGELLEAGRALVAAIERDHGLDGMLEGKSGTPGREVLAWMVDETRKTLRAGRNAFSTTNRTGLPALVALTRPGGMRRYERRALREVMDSPSATRNMADAECFVELLSLVQAHPLDAGATEVDAVAELTKHAGADLHRRLTALQAFEDFARDLTWAFDGFRWLSTTTPGGTPSPASVRTCDAIAIPAGRLHSEYARACEHLGELVNSGSDATLGSSFATAFDAFSSPLGGSDLVDALVAHHGAVQAGKAPYGKRSWFDDVAGQWAVRTMYAVHDQPEHPSTFEHPYRFGAMYSFLDDLHG